MIQISCEEVIILDLDKTEPIPVIEATMDAGRGVVEVFVSSTSDFYGSSSSAFITGADVSLRTNGGQPVMLNETEAGRYFIDGLTVTPGETYTLVAGFNGKNFQASSVVPYPVTLDSIRAQVSTFPFGDGKIYSMSAHWTDAPGHTSFYQVRTTINDTLNRFPYVLINDKYIDGSEITVPIPAFLKGGDRVKVQLLAVDSNWYNYFVELWTIIGGNTSAPYNPEGNFGKEALGYFGIYYSSEKTVVLRQ